MKFFFLFFFFPSYPKQACPGGAALNTLRVFQWLHGLKNASVFFGSVGNDATSRKLLEQVSHAGVDVRYVLSGRLLIFITFIRH